MVICHLHFWNWWWQSPPHFRSHLKFLRAWSWEQFWLFTWKVTHRGGCKVRILQYCTHCIAAVLALLSPGTVSHSGAHVIFFMWTSAQADVRLWRSVRGHKLWFCHRPFCCKIAPMASLLCLLLALVCTFLSVLFAFSALTLLVGVRKSIRRVKNWVMRCWHGCLSGVRCNWYHMHIVQLMLLPPRHLLLH